MKVWAFALAALVCAGAAPAMAQEEAIIVTGTRIEAFESFQMPHIHMERRADSVIVELSVRSDTRDLSQRTGEMRDALRGLQSRAQNGAVALAIADDEAGIVRAFSMAAAEELIRGDHRPDTSFISIQLRTPVSADDTLEAVQARIERFVEAAAKPGRIEMETGEVNLVLNNPEQYRIPLVRDIAGDGRNIAAMLGPEYGVHVSGLERQVAWRRTGDLELTLFLPYSLNVARAS